MDLFRDVAGGDEWSCEQLRRRHGDFLDSLLSEAELAQVQMHLDECADCARYDRIVRRGLQLARELPEPTPAADFEVRLQRRIFHVQHARALGQQRPLAGVGVTAAAAGLIALIAWSPFLLLDRSIGARGSVVAGEAGAMTVGVPAADPLGMVAVSWYPGHVPALPTRTRAVRPTVFPGPYSPLIVNPPVHGGPVRTVSTEYHPVE